MAVAVVAAAAVAAVVGLPQKAPRYMRPGRQARNSHLFREDRNARRNAVSHPRVSRTRTMGRRLCSRSQS